MGSDLVHPLCRQLHCPPPGDELEPIATLANLADPGVPLNPALRQITLALGGRGSYRVEVEIRLHEDGLRGFVPRAVQRSARFAELLREGLDEAQRDALGLTRERFDALEELDATLLLLGAGDLVAARPQLAHCFARLQRHFAVTEIMGDARLRRPVVRSAATASRLGERALATFLFDPSEALGRLRQVVCAVADLVGGERAAWEERPNRGRSAAFFAPHATPEDVRASLNEFETIELPYGLVHPALLSALAHGLGISAEELRARVRGDDLDDAEDDEDAFCRLGPRALGEELGADDAFVRAVPLVPEDERPTLYFPAADADGGETELSDPLSQEYALLRARIDRDQRLVELGAPTMLLHENACALQRRFESLIETARTPPELAALDGWGPPCTAPREVRLTFAADEGDDEALPSAVWLTPERIVVAHAGIARVIDLSERRVVREVPIGPTRLQACDDGGRLIVVSADSLYVDDDGVPEGFGCFDASTGAWLEALPAAFPAVTFGKNEPERGVLFELRRGRAIELCGDRPTALAYARGNCAVLLSEDYAAVHGGGVRSTLTGLLEVSDRALPPDGPDAPVLALDGSLCTGNTAEDHQRVDVEMEERWGERYHRPHPAAIAHAAGWRFLLPSLEVGELRRTWFRLGFAIDAASFSPDATQLLAVGDELSVIDLESRAITWRARLDELA